MMTDDDNISSLRSMKRTLVKAHNEISKIVDSMEAQLTTEYEVWGSKEYSLGCRTLGILEEQIATISNHITKLKK